MVGVTGAAVENGRVECVGDVLQIGKGGFAGRHVGSDELGKCRVGVDEGRGEGDAFVGVVADYDLEVVFVVFSRGEELAGERGNKSTVHHGAVCEGAVL